MFKDLQLSLEQLDSRERLKKGNALDKILRCFLSTSLTPILRSVHIFVSDCAIFRCPFLHFLNYSLYIILYPFFILSFPDKSGPVDFGQIIYTSLYF